MRSMGETISRTNGESLKITYVECIFTHQMAIMGEINVLFSFSFKLIELDRIIS